MICCINKQVALSRSSVSKMWFFVICLLVASGRTQNAHREENIRHKNDFEDQMLRELESTRVLISPREELQRTVDIVEIEDKDFITLRDLKISKDPVLRITSLDSTLSLFSTRIGVEFGDIFFTGEIYINEDKPSDGDVRFTLKNLKASGHVGLGLTLQGTLMSTNYYINYEHYEYESSDERFTKLAHTFSDKLLEKGARRVINAMLKRRIDSALSKISFSDVYGTGRSDVVEMKAWLSSFYDSVVDSFLEDLNKRFVEENMDQVILPDVNLPFTYSIMSVPVRGQVLASNGWLRDLGTFVRRGSVSVSFVSGSLVIFGGLGLAELELGYEDCTVTVGGIGPSGSLSGTIGNNEVQIAILVNLVNQTINLENFEISELSNLDVELSGLGAFNWLASKIAGWLMNGLITDVVPIIEPMIRDQILEALKNMNISVFI